MIYHAPKTERIPCLARAIWKALDSAERFLIVNGTEIRSTECREKRERLSLLKVARGRKVFPLYRNGRMIVQHPEY